MKTFEWLKQFEGILQKEETAHFDVHTAKVQMQFKNSATGEIELHEWDYESTNAERGYQDENISSIS